VIRRLPDDPEIAYLWNLGNAFFADYYETDADGTRTHRVIQRAGGEALPEKLLKYLYDENPKWCELWEFLEALEERDEIWISEDVAGKLWLTGEEGDDE
jgi:hypothetical protein